MTNKPTSKESGSVSCEVCLKEIPESVAMSSEGNEYTQHFCGIECYERWRSGEKSDSATGSHSAKE